MLKVCTIWNISPKFIDFVVLYAGQSPSLFLPCRLPSFDRIHFWFAGRSLFSLLERILFAAFTLTQQGDLVGRSRLVAHPDIGQELGRSHDRHLKELVDQGYLQRPQDGFYSLTARGIAYCQKYLV